MILTRIIKIEIIVLKYKCENYPFKLIYLFGSNGINIYRCLYTSGDSNLMNHCTSHIASHLLCLAFNLNYIIDLSSSLLIFESMMTSLSTRTYTRTLTTSTRTPTFKRAQIIQLNIACHLTQSEREIIVSMIHWFAKFKIIR